MSEEFVFTMIEVATEMDVSLATAKKYFKQFKVFIPHEKRGRTPFFSREGLRRMKFLRRLHQEKKGQDKIEAAMAKKYPEEAAAYQEDQAKVKDKKAPLIKRVESLEKRLEGVARYNQLDKRLSALEGKSGKSSDKDLKQKLEKLEKELDRIRKILEG